MTTTSDQYPTTPPAAVAGPGPAHPRRRARDGGGLLGRVTPNSRTHWTLIILGLLASVVFNATVAVNGLIQPGYDTLRQPMSALSLGPAGWVQITNFIAFGVLGCVTALAWRPTLAPGIGTVWYPRLKILAGLTLICAGMFTQDPALGYPVGAAAPAQPSGHAMIHNVVSYVSLITTVAVLLVLARRLHREPDWRGWATAAVTCAVAMMGFLATFGILISHGGPGGIFEKLASLTPTLFGIALTARLVARRDARITTTNTTSVAG